MTTDYIALRHVGAATTLALMPASKASELIQRAVPKDTLHKVPDEVRLDIHQLMNYIQDQLNRGEYVTVPG